MEIITDIIKTTLESFDFAYCIVVNILTYFIIRFINDKQIVKLNTWNKRLVLLVVIIAAGVAYYLTGTNTRCILNSAILAPVFWSWILKPICKKFNIDYKQINVFE